MFVCKRCKKSDKFELVLSHDYQGNGEIIRSYDSKKNLKLTIDGYTFTPNLIFMNNHAVCSYCGSIYSWEYGE